jgi:1,4-dihydroxy-2-naphthoate octaprenyltransferase
VKAWLQAARPLAHANLAPGLVFGWALALHQGAAFDLGLIALVHLFGILDHLVIVFGNDVADEALDRGNEAPTPFSGGSRVLVEGKLSATALRRAALGAAVALLALSVAGAVLLDRVYLPAFALAALALLHGYSFPPLRASYRGFGEILQAVGVGMVLPLVGYSTLAGGLRAFPWEVLAPLVLIGFGGNILTALPDTPADRAGGKRSWPVRRGEARARQDALVLTGLALLFVAAVSPSQAPAVLAAALGLPVVLTLGALRYSARADSSRPAECLRFVFLAAAAGGLVPLLWGLALWGLA